MTEKHLTDHKFTEFSLDDRLLRGLAEAGFEYCTPIQAQSLPHALDGTDVAGQAKTGTGKTIAFLLACCQRLLTREPLPGYQQGEPRALILAPTRELAIQIHKDALLLGRFTGLSIGLVYGGTGYEQQKNMLSGNNDILIGTPGRLIDFYRQNLFSLKHADVAILDEADRMFDLGFIRDIRYLLRRMPTADQRLNLLYSATLSYRVMELAFEHMNSPMEIKVDSDEVIADKVVETSYYPSDEEKLPLLVNQLKQIRSDRVLVFVNTRHAAEDVANALLVNGIESATLSGDVPQKKREKLLAQFKEGKKRVLVATDVAARGLHIPSVGHVFNYDLPQDAEDYVHRIGRTARAGASGEAVSFICEKYAYSIMEIEEFIGHSLPKNPIDPSMLAPIQVPPRHRGRDRDRGRHGSGREQHREARGKSPRGTGGEKRSGLRENQENRVRADKPETSSNTPSGHADDVSPTVPLTVTMPELPKKQETGREQHREARGKSPRGMGGEKRSGLRENQEDRVRADKPETGGKTPSGQADDVSPAVPVPELPKKQETVREDTLAGKEIRQPQNQRFSRRFGEVPAIG